MQATTKDLRLRTKEILAASQRGEEVIITFRGEPRAVLSPLPILLSASLSVIHRLAFGPTLKG